MKKIALAVLIASFVIMFLSSVPLFASPPPAGGPADKPATFFIDNKWPAAAQFLAASDQLYGMQKDVASVAFLTSTYLARDAADAGICPQWVAAAGACLQDTDPQAQTIACQEMDALAEQLYGDFLRLTPNLSSDPDVYSNAHVLAAVAVDEFVYKLGADGFVDVLKESFCVAHDKQEMMQIMKGMGDPGKMQGPIGASGNASPKGEKANTCSGSGVAEGGIHGPDPGPEMPGDAGGIAKGIQGMVGKQMGSPTMCPVHMKPSVTNGSPQDADKEKELEEKQRREAEKKAAEEKKKREEGQKQGQQEGQQQGGEGKFSCGSGSCFYKDGDFVVGGGKNAAGGGGWGFIGGKVAGITIGNAGSAGFLPGGGVYVTTGIGILWMPGPDQDFPAGGICGGMHSSIASCLVEQMGEQSEEEECQNEIMKHCAVAQCTQEYMNSLCDDGGSGTGAVNLTAFPNYGLINPGDEDPFTPPQDDPCKADLLGKPMTPQQQKACCEAKPEDPMCTGGGGNPLYHQGGLAAQPGAFTKDRGGLMHMFIKALHHSGHLCRNESSF